MDIKDACKKISKDTGIDIETVRDVVKYIFDYTANKMKDPNNHQDILFNKLFKFKLKSRYK